MHRKLGCVAVVALFALPAVADASAVNVLTYHNNSYRTGWNSQETQLTAANVNAGHFGLMAKVPLDGRVDTQPLVVAQQPLGSLGTHDVVYLGTENNTVYAIDANSGTTLLSRHFSTPVPYAYKNGNVNVYPVIGITGTPVIDVSQGALYVVTDAWNGSSDLYALHKLSLIDLSDMVPAVSVTASTSLSNGVKYTFGSRYALQRAALLESNGNIYVPFATNGDVSPSQSRGLLVSYLATTLQAGTSMYPNRLGNEPGSFYVTGIWQSGYGPAADSLDDIFFSTSNSDPRNASYNAAYNLPESILKLNGATLAPSDSFTPYNYFNLDIRDADLGSGGTLLVPETAGQPNLVFAGGKDGRGFLLNRDKLGGYTPNGPDQVFSEVEQGVCWCGPSYYAGADLVPRIITGGRNGVQSFKLDFGPPRLIPEFSTGTAPVSGMPDFGGTFPVISSNGTVAGTAVVWWVQRPATSSTTEPGTALTLHAYNAANFTPLYSAQAGTWLAAAESNANVTPTVANGKVYVASERQLEIFGLH